MNMSATAEIAVWAPPDAAPWFPLELACRFACARLSVVSGGLGGVESFGARSTWKLMLMMHWLGSGPLPSDGPSRTALCGINSNSLAGGVGGPIVNTTLAQEVPAL